MTRCHFFAGLEERCEAGRRTGTPGLQGVGTHGTAAVAPARLLAPGQRQGDEGRQHPDRDGQFNYLNEMAATFIADGQPVISTDTKKKALIGDYKNGGEEWSPWWQA